MILFVRLIWPRSWRSLASWTPLLVVGAISCAGLSLALGLGFGFLAQQNTATLRDGPRGLPPRAHPVEGPLRASDLFGTGYGPLVITVFTGEEGQQLGLPGLPTVESSGTMMASPAVIAQSRDDWTGEIDAWLGGRNVQRLPDAALAHPHEMVIVEFLDAVPQGFESEFYPVRDSKGWPRDSSFVIIGILVLVLPSIAIARAGAAVHLSNRARRYGLLRTLGTPPRQLAAMIAADMTVPLFAGALVGSLAYAALMSSWGSFTLAGASYWTHDLPLPIAVAAIIPLVTALVGLVSVTLMVYRAGRDPIGTMRRDRPRRISYITYISAVGLLAGPAAIFAATDADFTQSVWLISGGLLLSVVGLGGVSRLAVTVSGRLLLSRTRALVAGSRMSRSGGEALLGVSATAVAVLLIVFLVYSNFDRSPATVGDFDVVVEFEEEVESRGSLADLVAAQDGVARTVIASRIPVEGDFSSVYTMTCADVPGSVTLDGAPCAAGLLYIPRLSQVQGDAIVAANDPQWFGGPANDLAQAIAGAYPVAGTVSASWITSEHRALLIVDEQPTPEYGVLLVTTDGSDGSLRGVMRSLRNQHGVNAVTTQAALASGVTEDTLILDPYLWVVAITASGLATVALFYAVLLLFRQRQIEFNMLRAQGATQTLLAVDLGLLFAMPLVLAFGLAVAAGMVMATAFNAGLGLPTPYASTQAVPALATMLAVGMTAAVLVAVRATRIPTLLSDPDAGAA